MTVQSPKTVTSNALKRRPPVTAIVTFLLLGGLALMPLSWVDSWLPVSAMSLFDILHFPAALLTVFLLFQMTRSIATALGLTLVLAVALELVQPLFGRSGSFKDLYHGLLGILFAGFILGAWQKGARAFSLLFGALAIGMASLSLQPLLEAYEEQNHLRSLFPVLGNFEDDEHGAVWKPLSHERLSLVHRDPENGWALSVDGKDIAWPGVVYYPVVNDWSRMRRLCFDARGSHPRLTLIVRVRDTPDGKGPVTSSINQFTLEQDWRRYCLSLSSLRTPRGTSIRLDKVHKLLFVLEHKVTGDMFFIDNIKLKP